MPWWDDGETVERHCQQWTINKHAFAALVCKALPIKPHVLVAWMGVESGGSTDRPSDGKFNYLQIKGPVGFASYPTVHAAARSTVQRIKAEPAIMSAIRTKADNSKLMTAIAVAWDDASGVPKRIPTKPLVGPEAEYRQRLQDKYDCIDGFQVLQDLKIVGSDPVGWLEAFNPRMWGAIAKTAGEQVSEGAAGMVGNWVNAIWPVLLKTAGAATGLALIGYGITQLAKSSTAGVAAQKAAPVVAEVAS